VTRRESGARNGHLRASGVSADPHRGSAGSVLPEGIDGPSALDMSEGLREIP